MLLPAAHRASGQISPTGLDQFGTYHRNHIQTINLYNLNNHIEIPLFTKNERGVNFYAKLVWDQSDALAFVQVPYPPGGDYFQPNGGPALFAVTGVYYQSQANGGQTCNSSFQYQAVITTFNSIVDQNNTVHPMPYNSSVETGQGCGAGTFIRATQDGKWLLTVVYTNQNCSGINCITSVTETDTSGNVYGGTAALTDPNGNQITTSTPTPGNSTWTDPTGNIVFTAQEPSPPPYTFSYPIQSGGMANVQMNFTSGFTLQNNFGCGFPYTYTTTGLPTSISLPDGTSYSFVYESANGSYPSSTVTGRIHSITVPAGGTWTYTYSGGTNGINCYGTPGSPATITITASDGSAWTYNSTICTSNCGLVYSTTVVTDPACNDTIYTFGAGGGQMQSQSYQGTAGTAGCPASTKTLMQTVVTCYAGNFTNCATSPGPGSPNCSSTGICQVDKYTYLPGIAQPSLSETVYNAADLPIQDNEYDFGVNTGSAPTTTPLRSTMTSYANIGNHIFDRPSCVQVSGGTSPSTCGTVTSNTKSITNYLNYDSQGNVGQIQKWVSGSTYVSENFTYYSTGLVHTATDFKSNQTTYTYGACNNSYLTNTLSPLNQSTSMTWDCNGGLATSTTDENSQTTNYSYTNPSSGVADPFWRLTRTTYPDTGKTTVTYNDTANPVNVTTNQLIDNSGHSITTQTNSDSFGRPVTNILTSDPVGTTYTATVYDGFDRVAKVFNPTRCNPPTTNCGTESTWGFTTYSYDALGRPTSVTEPDNSVIFTSYSGNCTTVTDEASKSRQSCFDALGRLTQVLEDPGPSPHLNFETDYVYDALGNLLCVGQKGTNTGTFSGCASIPASWRPRSFVYDSLSRLTSATTPESGIASYTYDANGNLTSKTSPAPNQTGSATVTVSYCYDALDRVTSKSYVGQPCPMSSPNATYTYDLTYVDTDPYPFQNPVGRLVKGWQAGLGVTVITYLDYDTMGRNFHRAQCVWQTCNNYSTWWIVTNGYSLVGDLASYTDAFGHTLSQAFDNAGRPFQLNSSWVDSTHPGTLANVGFPLGVSNGFTPAGQITNLYLADGPMETRYYNNRLQPCRINWNSSGTSVAACSGSAPSGNLVDFTYGFVDSNGHNNGNIATWNAAGKQTFTRSYQYDSLNRLTSMSSPSDPTNCTGLSWNYDAWGNRVAQTATGGSCYQQPGTTFSSKNQLPPPYQYDAAGNMTSDGLHQYFYDAENHLVQVDGGSLGSVCSSTANACYLYNTDGQRVYKYIPNNNSPISTSYIYGSDGQVVSYTDTNSNWNGTYIHFGGDLVGLYAGTGTYFYHRDHLGSTRLGTDVNGNVTTNPNGTGGQVGYDYQPFGEQLTVGGETDIKFTGLERDSETGLDHTDFRQYSSQLGRWMSPDPASLPAADPDDPQSWNMYSYVENQPMDWVDPLGLCGETTQVTVVFSGAGPPSTTTYPCPWWGSSWPCFSLLIGTGPGCPQAPKPQQPPQNVACAGSVNVHCYNPTPPPPQPPAPKPCVANCHVGMENYDPGLQCDKNPSPCTYEQKKKWCADFKETIDRMNDKVGNLNLGPLGPILSKVPTFGKALAPVAVAQGVIKANIDSLESYRKDVCRAWGIK